MKILFASTLLVVSTSWLQARPVPSPALRARLAEGIERIGIVHWGLNTYTDREWGFGDEDPGLLAPSDFDADQIVSACKTGGLQGLIIVAKHHDGFCLWPTKTTAHNIARSPFRGGKGDYVGEMVAACRKAGLKVGVYVSPWDRNNAGYATARYVATFHEQVRELLDGRYGEIFEMWFDGANGGDGWYGGAAGRKGETRRISAGYYRYPELLATVRRLQPKACVFGGEMDGCDFRWPGNEQGWLYPDSRATICTMAECARNGWLDYNGLYNTGTRDGCQFMMCEADFPLRPGWFYHPGERGRSRHGAYLMRLYLESVGNGGIMNIGVAPDRRGRMDDEDVRALAEFGAIRERFFADEVTEPGRPFNVIALAEDLAEGEQVDRWQVLADGWPVLEGEAIGYRRIRTLFAPIAPAECELRIVKHGEKPGKVTMRRYMVDPGLLRIVMTSTSATGETDTAKWMTGRGRERK